MRFATTQPKAYGGLDLHARTMYICLLNHAGEVLVPPHCTARPAPCRKGIAP
jgi:hypothetical protein